ncbi:MAG: Gfo/Idh/MocA family oxidoreductase [Bacteroidota bacterium]
MNRREFLQQSTAYSLVGMGLGIPAPSGEAAVKVAVVGTGGRGTDLIRKLSTIDRAIIVAICDDYPPHLQRAQIAAGPQARAFDDYSHMLEQIQPDAVIIATPLYVHARMCLEALQAGCAVFCEKTMCYSIKEAKRLLKEVRQRKAIFQVGLQRRANPIYRQAKAMIDTGMLGQISAIKCQWHRNNDWRRPVPVSRDHHDWKRLEHKLNWRLYASYSRGLMTELASHQLDVVNWFLDSPPTSAIGTGGIDFWQDGREVFDNLFCLYEYPAKNAEGQPYTVRVSYSSLQNNAFEGASELIMGSKGSLFITSKKGLFYQEKRAEEIGWTKEGRVERDADIITGGKTLKLSNDPWAHRSKPYEIDTESNDTRDELIAFLDCVQRKDPDTICDVEQGWLDTATVMMGHEALTEEKKAFFPD